MNWLYLLLSKNFNNSYIKGEKHNLSICVKKICHLLNINPLIDGDPFEYLPRLFNILYDEYELALVKNWLNYDTYENIHNEK